MQKFDIELTFICSLFNIAT